MEDQLEAKKRHWCCIGAQWYLYLIWCTVIPGRSQTGSMCSAALIPGYNPQHEWCTLETVSLLEYMYQFLLNINDCGWQHTNTMFLLEGSPRSLALDYFSYGRSRENFQQISLKCIKHFQGYWNGGVGMLCWSLIISLLQVVAYGILSVRVFNEKNVPIFLSRQAVSILKQQQETTYRALLSLANSS